MHLRNFDLNLLRALDALLRERNVTRAAERLHVTQQAMSGSLRRLREHFGDQLLIRIGQRYELTPQGSALVEPIHEAMLQIGHAIEARPTFSPASAERRFSIAMSDYATVTVLPLIMARLSTEAPGVVLDIRLIDNSVFRDLEDGRLDLGLLPKNWRLYQEDRPRGIRSVTLHEDDFVCVVDRENEAVGDTIDVEQYLAMPHTMLRLGGGVRSIVEAAWINLGIAPHVAATATSFASLVFMIPNTRLIATVQRRLARQFARMLSIRIVGCPIAIEPLRANMSWHFRNERDPAHAYLRSVFADAGRQMA